ncbi:hypothetical protein DPMN_144241 [Dreissena polymorpha]|uniref:Uncharacterized protein n=1 Tax=Dreissena polymorpha TaxID=45954 RepID=A0A9D4GEN1_DREPO|nr:hypothetical protein DPMN_144241 [Dreissena polymorpha]
MTQEDPDIQMLLDYAKDLYSSLLRGKTTLADDMLCDFDQTPEGYREAGLGLDLVIEQTLMILTRGSGMTEEMPTIEHNSAMQNFTDLTYTTMAGSHVNVNAIEAVGKTIIRDIIGESVLAHEFTRKYRTKSLWNSLAVKIASDSVFDPALLFQCFLSYCLMNRAPILLPFLKPRTYFVQQISLRSLRKFDMKGITDKRQWGSMATKTVIITKTKRTGNVNHIDLQSRYVGWWAGGRAGGREGRRAGGREGGLADGGGG